MENLNYLMSYIGVWGWQIISMLFLVGALIVVVMPIGLVRNAVLVACVLSWVMCEYMMLKRKKELRDYDE